MGGCVEGGRGHSDCFCYAFSGQFRKFFIAFSKILGFGRCLGERLGEPLGGYLGWLLEGRRQGKGRGEEGHPEGFFSCFQPFSAIFSRFQLLKT